MTAYEIRRILVPIDFSEVAANSLETAVAICKRQLTTLTLVHVVESTFHLMPPETGSTSATVLSELVRKANDHLNEMAKDLRLRHDIVVNHVVQSGNPADEICGWAYQKKTDLIVMGTHGASGLRAFFMGSNAYRVVKNAPCPVMTIPGTNTWIDFKKILFPVRLVPNALDKYDFIRPIIRKNASSLYIAGIVKNNDADGAGQIEGLLDRVKLKLQEDHVLFRSEVIHTDDVAKQVLQVSETEKPDLIVITATLDESLKDFFLGPYTQDIVNHANFPVLSIRPQVFFEESESRHSLRQQG